MTTPNRGELLVAADSESLTRLAAHLVRAWVSEAARTNHDGVARVAISGGSTPRAMNKLLATMSVPWAATEWFWVDERAVPMASPRSNAGAAQDDLFSHLAVPPRGVHAMQGDQADLDGAARSYEKVLGASFGIQPLASGGVGLPSFDLLLLGIGDDGHTASLFPGNEEIDVTDRWAVAVPAAEGREARITLTRPVITAARRVVVLAQGEAKRGPIERARIAGPLRETPARLTQEVRGELLWLIDAAARPAG
jgi:6-phosphogluconolactonase